MILTDADIEHAAHRHANRVDVPAPPRTNAELFALPRFDGFVPKSVMSPREFEVYRAAFVDRWHVRNPAS